MRRQPGQARGRVTASDQRAAIQARLDDLERSVRRHGSMLDRPSDIGESSLVLPAAIHSLSDNYKTPAERRRVLWERQEDGAAVASVYGMHQFSSVADSFFATLESRAPDVIDSPLHNSTAKLVAFRDDLDPTDEQASLRVRSFESNTPANAVEAFALLDSGVGSHARTIVDGQARSSFLQLRSGIVDNVQVQCGTGAFNWPFSGEADAAFTLPFAWSTAHLACFISLWPVSTWVYTQSTYGRPLNLSQIHFHLNSVAQDFTATWISFGR